jgi:RNA polymerase sigma-70 factor (ECF subfamily)
MRETNQQGDRTFASAREAPLVSAAKRGDREALERLTEPHRRELRVHCYRMLGSFHDAEDAVQETFLRASRGLQRFDGRASVRVWLYRIATNVCLNVLGSRRHASRVLPETQNPPAQQMPGREPASEIAWLEPYPDSALENVSDNAGGPDVRYEMREAVHLAFIAAIQFLPPRQRAALLLHDVLGWSAAETGRLLDSSIAAVNSALQRARATLDERLPSGLPPMAPTPSEEHRVLLERYVRAWESTDVDAFTALLMEDAVLSMPPWTQWYQGRDSIRTFFAFTGRSDGHAPFRLLPVGANLQPSFAFYSRWQGPEWQFHSIQLVTLRGSAIHHMTSFVMPALASVFGLSKVLPADDMGRTPSR